ncbi:MAG: ATP-dependent RecD-like DNA helicase, partial [Chlamydiia bacterium]|nr:ATP-dependent RecD-like DNA helicase [Chlamydiia bacterium]
MENLSGYVEAIVYTVPENGFTVARLRETGKKELTTIVGCLPSLQPGETVKCQGEWKMHPSHGRQFEVSDHSVEMPCDVVGIQKYLESGLVDGIGEVFARRIVERFGVDTLQVLDEMPSRLLEIEGLGRKKLKKIKECWSRQRSIREVMIFLRTHGLSPGYAQRIYRAYGEKSIEKVKENPYQLAKEVDGIGFKMADAIAQKLGLPLHSPERIGAGIEFVLWELSNEGHTCYPLADFMPIAEKMLEVEGALIEAQIDRNVQKERLVKTEVKQEARLWLKTLFSYEENIGKDLLRIKNGNQTIRAIDTEKAVDWVQKQLGIEFASQQIEAVKRALSDKVHIITGGPGTGKSTITNAILRVTEKLTGKILLAAPTGRAAKRLTQITRKMAFTIHALLEMDFANGGFKRGRENPLDCDLLIIDEASMIDTMLLFFLLRATPSHTRLLFIGDIDQLPSVGAGNVLRDIISSAVIPTTTLTEIFRQAKGSKIITNAHLINRGEFPDLMTHEKSDFHFIEADVPEAISEVILQLVSKEIPERWGFDRWEEIQVISPMKRGIIGCEMLNQALQSLLNPSQTPLFRGGTRYHVGDKVMQICNNYDKKVYNGDIGRITAIQSAAQKLQVDFDRRLVEYDFSEL